MTENNARIRCFGKVAIRDWEVVDGKAKVWKGIVVPNAGTKSDDNIVFFSRKYDYVNSDIDRMLDEVEIKDSSLLGFPFLLVPKDKLLFGFLPHSSIVIPEVAFVAKDGRTI